MDLPILVELDLMFLMEFMMSSILEVFKDLKEVKPSPLSWKCMRALDIFFS